MPRFQKQKLPATLTPTIPEATVLAPANLPFTTFESDVSEQNQVDSVIENLSVQLLLRTFELPHTAKSALSLIKTAVTLSKHRRLLYNLQYGNKTEGSSGGKPTTISLD